MKTTDTRLRCKAASLTWGVSSYAFGGRGEELSCTMMSMVQFKRFSEILLVQVDGGANALDMDWAPGVATMMHPLEYGTPRKVTQATFTPEVITQVCASLPSLTPVGVLRVLLSILVPLQGRSFTGWCSPLEKLPSRQKVAMLETANTRHASSLSTSKRIVRSA
jgi:hypothetical protein